MTTIDEDRVFRVALVQLPWTGDRETMKAQYHTLITYAVEKGATLICLPEFSLSPYFPGIIDIPAGDKWLESVHGGESDQFFGGMAKIHGVSIISSIFEKTSEGELYDTSVLHSNEVRDDEEDEEEELEEERDLRLRGRGAVGSGAGVNEEEEEGEEKGSPSFSSSSSCPSPSLLYPAIFSLL
jgi:hypothetical protein